MTFSRTITLTGVSEVDSIDVNINLSYETTTPPTPPTQVNFSFTTLDNVTVSGTCDSTKINTYYVYDGIVTDELLALVETECKRVLANYETV